MRMVLKARTLFVCSGMLLFVWLHGAAGMIRGSVDDARLDAAERQRVIDGAVRNLREHYFDRDVAGKMADTLLAHEKTGDYSAVMDGAAFAALLTKQMREVSHDMHLEVVFDHPEYMYSPRESPAERLWTRSPVAGNKLADKPAYVLTSGTTWSAAEQFSYDLKMLKRATLVGEKTRGGAHAGAFYRIDDHFGMGIPEVKAVNPFGKNDWEGVGVEPDVKVKAEDALETAQRLAESKLNKKSARR